MIRIPAEVVRMFHAGISGSVCFDAQRRAIPGLRCSDVRRWYRHLGGEYAIRERDKAGAVLRVAAGQCGLEVENLAYCDANDAEGLNGHWMTPARRQAFRQGVKKGKQAARSAVDGIHSLLPRIDVLIQPTQLRHAQSSVN